MTNALHKWFDEHKDEIDQEKEREAKRGQNVKKLEDGENIVDLKGITDVTDTIFEFTLPNGNINKVKRYFYHYGEYDESDPTTHPLMIPKSVHSSILDNIKEYGTKLKAVKVVKKGSNKDTEYSVFPQL